jgi:uncharacterized protein DUF4112
MAKRPPNDDLRLFRTWADLLDSYFRVPGTNIRFGIDPILSLIPVIGELASPVFTVALFNQARRQRVPRIVMLRMALNALLDALIGAIPFVGNVLDVFWRANKANLALLERHAGRGHPSRAGDYVFVLVIVAALVLVAAMTVWIGIWFVKVLWRGFAALWS